MNTQAVNTQQNEEVTNAPKRLTHSSMATFATCRRKYYLRYVERLKPAVTPTALRLGGAYHHGLEVYANTGSRDEAIKAVRTNYSELPDWAQDEESMFAWQVECETVVALVDGWIWRWQDDGVVIAEAEKIYQLPIRNPSSSGVSRVHTHAGKRDQLVILPDGCYALREFKTTSDDISPTSNYWKHLSIDPQISGYFESYAEEGIALDRVLYDVARKPGIRPRKLQKKEKDEVGQTGLWFGQPAEIVERETPQMYRARLSADIRERPDFYFARREITRLEGDQVEFRHDLWQTHQAIQQSERDNAWPRTGARTKACVGAYGACPFLELCSGGWEPSQGVPDGFQRGNSAHPELENSDATGNS